MTCLEKWKQDHPDANENWPVNTICPHDIGIDLYGDKDCNGKCRDCWDTEIPEPNPTPVIKDSGERRQFYDADGNPMAVRDIQKGKGRCDLMPLDVVAGVGECWEQWHKDIFLLTHKFQSTGDPGYLYQVLHCFGSRVFTDPQVLLLEVAKHFEEGAKKYGEHNWQKGIPVKCYIDSAVRHYLKWSRGDKDEPHDRAFCWNILCAIWTCKHKPELNDYEEK